MRKLLTPHIKESVVMTDIKDPENQVIIKQWVEALHSGRYNQGKLRLRRAESFCCLGVLANIVAPDQWVLGEDSDGEIIYLSGPINEKCTAVGEGRSILNTNLPTCG